MSDILFLIGYEKNEVKDFLNKLLDCKITTVIDIREHPVSRKKGFSKSELSEILRNEGIEYFHIKKLGAPKKIRENLKHEQDYLKFFEKYKKHLDKNRKEINNVRDILFANGRSALLCFEKDYNYCHRSVVAAELKKSIPKLEVVPL